MNFSWAMDLDPKGANNQIKEAIDKRYLPEDEEPVTEDFLYDSGRNPLSAEELTLYIYLRVHFESRILFPCLLP